MTYTVKNLHPLSEREATYGPLLTTPPYKDLPPYPRWLYAVLLAVLAIAAVGGLAAFMRWV